MNIPNVGSIVWVQENDGGAPSPAIITALHPNDTVTLQVFSQSGLLTLFKVSYSETLAPGYWSWPVYV